MMHLPEIAGYLTAFFVLLLLSAFFAGSETALITVNKMRLTHLADQGNKRAKVARELVLHLDKLITTILVTRFVI